MSVQPSVTVRTALIDDVPGCARLFAAGQQEIEPRIPPWHPDEFLAQTAGEMILVAAAGRQVAGFLSLSRHDAFVHFLHVGAAWRRQGIGRKLLASARAEVARPLQLKCLVSNRRALAFYHRLGWRPVRSVADAAAPFIRLGQPS